jgi:hypothetical protein
MRIHTGKILGGHDLSFVPCLSHWAEAPHTWEIMKFMQIEPWNSACYCYGQKHLKKYMKGKVPEICFHTNHTWILKFISQTYEFHELWHTQWWVISRICTGNPLFLPLLGWHVHDVTVCCPNRANLHTCWSSYSKWTDDANIHFCRSRQWWIIS